MRCLRGFTVVLQWCYSGVTMNEVFERCYSGVTVV
jgi:hypothetical protein